MKKILCLSMAVVFLATAADAPRPGFRRKLKDDEGIGSVLHIPPPAIPLDTTVSTISIRTWSVLSTNYDIARHSHDYDMSTKVYRIELGSLIGSTNIFRISRTLLWQTNFLVEGHKPKELQE